MDVNLHPEAQQPADSQPCAAAALLSGSLFDEALVEIEALLQTDSIEKWASDNPSLRGLTVKKVLKKEKLLKSFRSFLRTSLCEENLLFFQEASQFSKHPPSDAGELKFEALKLFRKYCDTGSELEVNISSSTRNKIKKTLFGSSLGHTDSVSGATPPAGSTLKVPKLGSSLPLDDMSFQGEDGPVSIFSPRALKASKSVIHVGGPDPLGAGDNQQASDVEGPKTKKLGLPFLATVITRLQRKSKWAKQNQKASTGSGSEQRCSTPDGCCVPSPAKGLFVPLDSSSGSSSENLMVRRNISAPVSPDMMAGSPLKEESPREVPIPSLPVRKRAVSGLVPMAKPLPAIPQPEPDLEDEDEPAAGPRRKPRSTSIGSKRGSLNLTQKDVNPLVSPVARSPSPPSSNESSASSRSPSPYPSRISIKADLRKTQVADSFAEQIIKLEARLPETVVHTSVLAADSGIVGDTVVQALSAIKEISKSASKLPTPRKLDVIGVQDQEDGEPVDIRAITQAVQAIRRLSNRNLVQRISALETKDENLSVDLETAEKAVEVLQMFTSPSTTEEGNSDTPKK